MSDVVPPTLPPVPPSPARPRRWVWFLVGLLSAGLIFVGCLALAVKDAQKKLDTNQRAHAISKEAFDAITIGMTETAVLEQLGRAPQDAQEFVQEGVVAEDVIESSCLYYNRLNGDFGDAFQFCFRDGTLISKGSL
jgi:hypothetical protein